MAHMTNACLELRDLEVRQSEMEIPDESTIQEYYELRKQLRVYTQDMRDVINHPHYSLQFMQSGRLVRIRHKEYDFGWGAVISFTKRKPAKDQNPEDITPQQSYVLDVLLPVADGRTNGSMTNEDLPPGIRPPVEGEKVKMECVPVSLGSVESIGHIRIFLPTDLKSSDQRSTILKSLEEVKKRFPDGIAVLDPIENMGITDTSFKRLLRVSDYLCHIGEVKLTFTKKIEVLESRLLSNPLHNSPRLPSLYNQYADKVANSEKIKALKKQIAEAASIIQLDELKCRKRILRRFDFINEADVVQIKARVACQISTGDELLLTELLFDRFFNELSPELCAATLSCFIFDEKVEAPILKAPLEKPFREIEAKARIVAKVALESKLKFSEEEYMKGFKFELMEVVYAWAHGKSFAEIWCIQFPAAALKVCKYANCVPVK